MSFRVEEAKKLFVMSAFVKISLKQKYYFLGQSVQFGYFNGCFDRQHYKVLSAFSKKYGGVDSY
jgi:hypothetical protein